MVSTYENIGPNGHDAQLAFGNFKILPVLTEITVFLFLIFSCDFYDRGSLSMCTQYMSQIYDIPCINPTRFSHGHPLKV